MLRWEALSRNGLPSSSRNFNSTFFIRSRKLETSKCETECLPENLFTEKSICGIVSFWLRRAKGFSVVGKNVFQPSSHHWVNGLRGTGVTTDTNAIATDCQLITRLFCYQQKQIAQRVSCGAYTEWIVRENPSKTTSHRFQTRKNLHVSSYHDDSGVQPFV